MRALILTACLVAPAALAAPRIESVTVKPNPAAFASGKAPQVEIAVSVARSKIGSNNCDASIDLGDGGWPKPLDFGVATTRTVRHVYEKDGTYKIAVKGSGATPCEGTGAASVTVTGAPAKKAEPKKKIEAKKKAEPKKAEPKKKGAEAPSSKDPAKP